MGRHVQEINLPKVYAMGNYASSEKFPTNLEELEVYLKARNIELSELNQGDIIIRSYIQVPPIDIVVANRVMSSGILTITLYIRKLGELEELIWVFENPS